MGAGRTISMTGTVNMAIVPVVGLVLDVGRVDGDTASLLLGRLVNAGVVGERCSTLGRQNLRNGGSERRLSVVNVTYCRYT